MTTSSPGAPRRVTGHFLLVLGLVLPTLGVIGYAVQLARRHLTTPWYMPVLATLGVICLAAAVWQARSVWRWLALVLVVLLTGAEWAMLLAMRLPAYAGPVAAGQPFPDFTTKRADGTSFTQRDLHGERDSVLVFF